MRTINPIEHLQSTSEMYADGIEKFLQKLTRGKSRLEVCDIISVTDDNGREIEVFYRVIDACPNAQTDISRDSYDVEQVLYKGKKVNLTSRGEQEIYEWLYINNPGKIHY